MAGAGHFAGGFMQAYAAARDRKEFKELQEKEIKARTTIHEIELRKAKREEAQQLQQQEARGRLSDAATGSSALQASPNTRLLDPEGPKSLVDMLANPQSTQDLLQSGFLKGEDVLKHQESTQNQGLLERLLGGGNPISESGAAGGAPRGPSAPPGGFEVSGIKLDASGKPMIDLARREVKRWLPSPDGRSVIGVDAMGQPMVSQPAGPGDRAPEDVPLTPDKLTELRTPDGRMLPPGTTLRGAQAMGAIASPHPAEADKKAVTLLKGMQDSELTISGLTGADTSSVRNAALSSTPVGELFASQDYRKFKSAGLRWAQNYLYLKSGAQASKEEVENTFKTFFPQPGDSDEVKAQKKAARLQEAQNITSVYDNPGGGGKNPHGLPPGIPPGSRQIGTSGGKPVYQTPDGKRLIVD